MQIEMDHEAAREDVTMMRNALAEFRAAARVARDEPCADEHHCACVPLLRVAAKEGEAHAVACQNLAVRAQAQMAALATMLRKVLDEGSTTWSLTERARALLREVAP